VGKEHIFKWAFRIPDLHTDANERDAISHLLQVMHPFTGKLTQQAYHQQRTTLP
jgi:hypothetical protein